MDPQALRALGHCAAERPIVRRRRLHNLIEHAALAALAAVVVLLAYKSIAVGLSVIFVAAAGAL